MELVELETTAALVFSLNYSYTREVSIGRTRNNAISRLFIELKLREVSIGRTRNNAISRIFFEL